MSTIVSVSKLWNDSHWKRWDDKYKYSKWGEAVACEWLARKKQWIVESVECEDSRYDAIVSGKKIEVKFQTSKNLSIEYCTDKMKPSGIMVTQSDYYLMINTGSSFIGGEWHNVGKVRLIPTHQLQRKVFETLEHGGQIVVHKGSGTGPGSHCIEIDPKSMINDGWIGDINFSKGADGSVFDFGPAPDMWSNQAIARIHDWVDLIDLARSR